MSDIYKELKQIIVKDVVVGKKCDVCFKDIPPTKRGFPRKNVPYYEITTHHNDWGNDSVDSYEHYHACSPECALKFAGEYINDNFEGCNSQTIEIEHKGGWFMPKEAEND